CLDCGVSSHDNRHLLTVDSKRKIFNENYEILNTPPSKQPISKLATHANGARTPLGNINGNKMVLRSNRQQQV
uniref:Uncharacterized protein n=1 Tax=Megaselia scalaris TaxID=36166 RepID=T1H4S1_MEGSC